MSLVIDTRTLPVASLPSAETTGWGSPADDLRGGIRAASMATFEETFQADYPTDQHFVGYLVYDNLGNVDEKMPRLRKTAAPYVLEAGQTPLAHLVSVDWDTPDHVPWTRELWSQFEEARYEAQAGSDHIGKWACWYTTVRGARFVYRLTQPVSLDAIEQLQRGMVDEFQLHSGGWGKVDDLKDWTRLMRLPRVTRDGAKTANEPFFVCQTRDRYLEVATAPRDHTHKLEVYRVEPLSEALPDSLVCKELRYTEKGNQATWFKAAKLELRGTEAHDVVTGKRPPEGNEDIFRIAGQVVNRCFHVPAISIEKCFGLLVEAVEQMPYDEGYQGESWEETLWRAIQHSWAQESARARELQEYIALRQGSSKDTWGAIIDGAKEWCAAAELRGSKEEAVEFLTNRLILLHGGVFYVMKPNGYFSEPIHSAKSVIPTIQHLGMDGILETTYVTIGKNNQQIERRRTLDALIQDHGVQVLEARAAFGSPKGSVCSGFHRPQVTAVTRPMYALNPMISGEYHAEVDAWLRCLTETDEEHNILKLWLSHALDFRQGIPLLALIGPPAVGKQLLVRGLAENLLRPEYSPYEGVTGTYQEGLLSSPFIVANEGFPMQPRQGMRMADQIRGLVSGDPQYVNVKYMPTTTVSSYYRVILTANNSGGLLNLYQNYDLDKHDRDAIAERIVFIRASRRAAGYLEGLGGMAYTARKGSRWVASPGHESDFIVARHIRWLYENRPPAPPGNRLLVDGFLPFDVLDDMALGSGPAPIVVRAVFALLQETFNEGLVIEDGKVMLTTNAVETYCLDNHQDVGVKRIGNVLKSLSFDHGRRMVNGHKLRYWNLDMERLLRQAEQDGVPIPREVLDKID